MTTLSLRLVSAPALAALCVILFEAIRTIGFGTTELSGVDGLGVFFGILGLAGTPLWFLGTVVLGAATLFLAGWREEREPTPPSRRVAWAVFMILAFAVLAIAVHVTVFKTVTLFKKPVYVGLAGALAAILAGGFLTLLSRPSVRVLTSLFDRWTGRGPRWLDPTNVSGASIWSLFLLGMGVICAPVFVKALHTVDLRPLRLLVFWAVLLAGVAHLLRAGTKPRITQLGALLPVLFVAGLAWSAVGLAGSQSRLASVTRDTILAGKAMSILARLGDADGDGVSRLFAGGDCDDTDPRIRPGVFDTPDDGIDQNCTGRDLVLKERRYPLPVRRDPGQERPWHVVLITVDALRADVVETHMPRLSAIARESIDFKNAYSHGAATYWSLASLMTSKMPSRIEMARDQTPVSREVLMTEVLRNAGWHTALFSNVTVFFVRGLRQGAQTTNYDTSHFTVHGAKPGSAHMTDGVLRHVDKWSAGLLKPKRDKFFLWAHYYDPHDPYFEVPDFKAADSSDKERYLAIVQYVDREIGRLIDGLKARGLWDKTLLILTADHGDEFLEHGHRFHGSTLYEEMTHVPLILHVPQAKPRRIEQPIGHVELAPTVLDLVGVKTPPAFEGRSRIGQVRTGGQAPEQPVFLEVFPDSNYSGHQVGLRSGDLKLIQRLTDNYTELFDLSVDPHERNNLVDDHPEVARLKALLGWYIDRHLFSLGQGKSGAKKPLGSPLKKKKKKRARRARTKARPRSGKPPVNTAPGIKTKSQKRPTIPGGIGPIKGSSASGLQPTKKQLGSPSNDPSPRLKNSKNIVPKTSK